MFNQLLNKVEGADIWMIMSFLIFFLFFLFMVIYLWKSDKAHLTKMSELPIEEELSTQNNQTS